MKKLKRVIFAIFLIGMLLLGLTSEPERIERGSPKPEALIILIVSFMFQPISFGIDWLTFAIGKRLVWLVRKQPPAYQPRILMGSSRFFRGFAFAIGAFGVGSLIRNQEGNFYQGVVFLSGATGMILGGLFAERLYRISNPQPDSV